MHIETLRLASECIALYKGSLSSANAGSTSAYLQEAMHQPKTRRSNSRQQRCRALETSHGSLLCPPHWQNDLNVLPVPQRRETLIVLALGAELRNANTSVKHDSPCLGCSPCKPVRERGIRDQ